MRIRAASKGSRAILAELCVLLGLQLSLWVNVDSAEATSNVVGTVASAGTWMTNQAVQAICTVGQGIPVNSCVSSNHILHGGFLRTFLMNPGDDHNQNGIPDEDDPDDDSDGLSDLVEIAGIGFDPVTPTDWMQRDSDGDGANDSSESRSGTNPLDENSIFQITNIDMQDQTVGLEWAARGGAQYRVIQAPDARSLATSTQVVYFGSALGGTGLWQETTSSCTVRVETVTSMLKVQKIP
jgi:hypothetical protein